MSSKQIQITVGFGLVLLIALAVIQGCGEITGDFNLNKPPIVDFVNVPEDAHGIDTTDHYGMPFDVVSYGIDVKILDMQGALMIPNSERVYALDETVMPPDSTFFVRNVDYTIDTVAVLLQAIDGGALELGQTYYIDFQFTIENYYVLSFAPMIYWQGSDPDGFVDHYLWADVSDVDFISAFRTDPSGYYQQHQHELDWIDTTAMSARIYLLTEAGDTTEHVIFIKAVDNLGWESEGMKHKTFFRSNNPPNNPTIKPMEVADTEFDQHYVVSDTLFALDEITPLWTGIAFNWRSDDPDDMELYQIPLEFTYYLIKTPGDTLWDHSNAEWSETTQIELFGLETGSYIFSVWVRDDGLTLSSEPAIIEFDVIKPTLDKHILLIDETKDSGPFEAPGADITTFYLDLLASLEGTLDYDNYVMDGVDVRLYDNSGSLTSDDIPMALIGQYKLVVIFADDHANANSDYIINRNDILADYLDIGGRLWFIGRHNLAGELGTNSGPVPTGANPLPSFIANYLQVETGYAADRLAPGQTIEFTGAIPVLQDEFDEINVDPSKVALIPDPQNADSTILMDIDWYTRSDEATTLYTFNSNTADTAVTNPYIYNEDSQVLAGATQERCNIMPLHPGILDVYRIENATKSVLGTIESWTSDTIRVSYQSEPWDDSDVLLVDYKYDPISEKHLKPVAIRYESRPRVLTTTEINGVEFTYYTYTLGYRTSLFGFPLYFMDNSNGEVESVARAMLNWFFYPTLHWQL